MPLWCAINMFNFSLLSFLPSVLRNSQFLARDSDTADADSRLPFAGDYITEVGKDRVCG